jgi:hypothetical protein
MSEQAMENLGQPSQHAVGPLMAAYREMAYRHELFLTSLAMGPAEFAWGTLLELSKAVANYEKVLSEIAVTLNPEER